ncbi:hypothetical protein B0H13DRAFT_2348174 [Mycena leptocephala]|nr:hypothetical protein B0H13DRAFT_2348174 [Mycena leptocephala]
MDTDSRGFLANSPQLLVDSMQPSTAPISSLLKLAGSEPTAAVTQISSPSDFHFGGNSILQACGSDTSNSQLMSQDPPIPPPEFTTFFDMSQHLGSSMSPSTPVVVAAVNGEVHANPMTSTPYRSQRECRAPKSPTGLPPTGND